MLELGFYTESKDKMYKVWSFYQILCEAPFVLHSIDSIGTVQRLKLNIKHMCVHIHTYLIWQISILNSLIYIVRIRNSNEK